VRWQTRILAALGALALALAAVGLYALIAYRVAMRTREIGVRIALGAAHVEIFREVVTHGLLIVAAGVVTGELAAAGVIRVVSARLPGIEPAGLATHLAAAAIWMVVAFIACSLPALRAARVDPLVALRHE
jgi:putative ABC transport system permease protein